MEARGRAPVTDRGGGGRRRGAIASQARWSGGCREGPIGLNGGVAGGSGGWRSGRKNPSDAVWNPGGRVCHRQRRDLQEHRTTIVAVWNQCHGCRRSPPPPRSDTKCWRKNGIAAHRRSPETRKNGKRMNTKDLEAHKHPTAPTAFSVFLQEFELDSRVTTHRREGDLYARALTHHVVLGAPCSHDLHNTRSTACTPVMLVRARRSRFQRPDAITPPSLSPTNSRTHTQAHKHTSVTCTDRT